MTETPTVVPEPEEEPINYNRVTVANGMLVTLGSLLGITAGLGVESWSVHPMFLPLGFLFALILALRAADAYVQK